MIELMREYWPVFLIAVVIGIIVGFLIFRPRQRVRLSESAPLRPHMSVGRDSPREGNGLAAEAAAAASDVTGEILGAQVHRHLGSDPGERDDFQRMKGVGPRLSETLHAIGFARFEQIAHLSDNEIDRVDSQLGAFRGRLRKDRIVEQADYLARGDEDGFERNFGKL